MDEFETSPCVVHLWVFFFPHILWVLFLSLFSLGFCLFKNRHNRLIYPHWSKTAPLAQVATTSSARDAPSTCAPPTAPRSLCRARRARYRALSAATRSCPSSRSLAWRALYVSCLGRASPCPCAPRALPWARIQTPRSPPSTAGPTSNALGSRRSARPPSGPSVARGSLLWSLTRLFAWATPTQARAS